MKVGEITHMPLREHGKDQISNVQEEYNFFHNTEIQVRFNDVDMMGHVNNAVYQNYFDYGKVKYFNEVLGEDVDWQENGLVLAKITVEYFTPILLNENICIRSKIIRIGNKSMDMLQEIFDSESGETKSTGLSVMVGYNFNSKSTVLIPIVWKQSFRSFEQKL